MDRSILPNHKCHQVIILLLETFSGFLICLSSQSWSTSPCLNLADLLAKWPPDFTCHNPHHTVLDLFSKDLLCGTVGGLTVGTISYPHFLALRRSSMYLFGECCFFSVYQCHWQAQNRSRLVFELQSTLLWQVPSWHCMGLRILFLGLVPIAPERQPDGGLVQT